MVSLVVFSKSNTSWHSGLSRLKPSSPSRVCLHFKNTFDALPRTSALARLWRPLSRYVLKPWPPGIVAWYPGMTTYVYELKSGIHDFSGRNPEYMASRFEKTRRSFFISGRICDFTCLRGIPSMSERAFPLSNFREFFIFLFFYKRHSVFLHFSFNNKIITTFKDRGRLAPRGYL